MGSSTSKIRVYSEKSKKRVYAKPTYEKPVNKKPAAGVISWVTRMQDPISNTFVWKIEGWSKVAEVRFYSQRFFVGDIEWTIDLGQDASTGYLVPYLSKVTKCTDDVYAQFSFKLRDQMNGSDKSWTGAYSYFGTDWGCLTFLPLAELNDPIKGFIVKDCLIFEATVTVLGMSTTVSSDQPLKKIDAVKYTPAPQKTADANNKLVPASPKPVPEGTSLVTRMQEPISSTFGWKIEGWSKVLDKRATSDFFVVSGISWRIYFDQETAPGYLGLFLEHNTLCTEDVYTHYTFVIRDQIHGKHKTCTGYHHYKRNSTWGESKGLCLIELNDPKKGFIVDDSCIFQATVTVLGYSHC